MGARPAGIQITKDDDRPWVEKWWTILHHVRIPRDIYADSSGVGNIEAESRANAIFIECDHLRDWLKWDKALGIPQKVIHRYAESSRPLQLANAICNSHKHHTRTGRRGKPPPMTARVWRFKTNSDGSSGAEVTIKLNWGRQGIPRYGLAISQRPAVRTGPVWRRRALEPCRPEGCIPP